MHEGDVVPTIIALSHTEQLDRLRLACPEAAPAARVIGDPCVDRLTASRPLRETYRQAFGLTAGQRLVVVTSTWGEHSLFGRWPELIRSLAQQLPLDTHRVALAMHPNVAHGHSPWQVQMWLDQCRRDGVLVLPDGDLWMPALVAADVVVGDHGSVSFYAAGLGVPLLLASAPADAVDPDSPVAGLLRLAPRLEPGDDLADRIEKVIDVHDPNAYTKVTSLATSRPGEFAALFRHTVLDMAGGLSDPDGTARTFTASVPHVSFSDPTAMLVRATLKASSHLLEAAVERFSAGSLLTPSTAPADAHLVVDAQELDASLFPMADVIVHQYATEADRWARETLRALPGCQLAAARDAHGWLLATPDGATVRIDAPRAGQAFASAAYTWLCSGNDLKALPRRLEVRLADETLTAAVAAIPPAGP